jgi:hypothetical protein
MLDEGWDSVAKHVRQWLTSIDVRSVPHNAQAG